MRLDAALWSEPSGLDVEEPAPAVVDREERIAAAKLGVVEQLVGEAMRAGALERAADELAVGPSEEEAAGLREECLAGFALELAPEIPGAAEERDVVGVLVVREPDDAREAARRAERVAARELLEAEHARAAPREVICGRAPVRAEADDDRVDCPGHRVSIEVSAAWLAATS